jgi:hypothetical protein
MRDREYDARVSSMTLFDPARAASGPNAESHGWSNNDQPFVGTPALV